MNIWKGEELADQILSETKARLEAEDAYGWLNVIVADKEDPYYKGILKDAYHNRTVIHTYTEAPETYRGAFISLDPMVAVPDNNNMDGGNTIPCTAEAIVRMLQWKGFRTESADVVIIGRSKRVGAPLAHLLTDLDSTVTLAHSLTSGYSLWHHIANADLVVSCVGNAGFSEKYKQFKPGATLIDVGGDFVGDIPTNVGNFVPHIGGIGPITRAVLLDHTAHPRIDWWNGWTLNPSVI